MGRLVQAIQFWKGTLSYGLLAKGQKENWRGYRMVVVTFSWTQPTFLVSVGDWQRVTTLTIMFGWAFGTKWSPTQIIFLGEFFTAKKKKKKFRQILVTKLIVAWCYNSHKKINMITFENLTVEYNILYMLNIYVKFCVNKILFTILSIKLFFYA